MLKTRIVFVLFNHRKLPKAILARLIPRPAWLTLKDLNLYVRLDDWAVGARIAVNRTYEKHVTAAIKPYFTPGIVMVDIGANIGYYTLMAAPRLSETGRIIAFEPSESNCNLLRMSVKRSGFQNIVLHQKAISDVNGTVGLNMDDSNGIVYKDQVDTRKFQVEAITLDDALREESAIDLIKMDVEGCEGLVLKGAKSIIERHRPVIFTEFRPPVIQSTSGMTADEFLDWLRGFGYELFVIDKFQGVGPQPQSNAEILAAYEHYRPSHIDLKAVVAHS